MLFGLVRKWIVSEARERSVLWLPVFLGTRVGIYSKLPPKQLYGRTEWDKKDAWAAITVAGCATAGAVRIGRQPSWRPVDCGRADYLVLLDCTSSRDCCGKALFTMFHLRRDVGALSG